MTGMSAVTDLPITVKMRTGIHDGKNLAHKLIARLRDVGVAMVAVSASSFLTCRPNLSPSQLRVVLAHVYKVWQGFLRERSCEFCIQFRVCDLS